ncbi:hypothetical protein HN51_002649 [Arachis hypogaea]|uniref:F-box protein At1g67340 n=1 Tax=Arachis hypogaea TaxID=3818 RepID=UPI000DED1CEF|nr:uncharacterized protein LOC112704014 [Arachis hypogaea]QHO50863.1 Putative F-box protein [Arachis hypogaea]
MADLGVINNKKQMKKMKKKKKKQVGQDHVFPSSCSFSSGIKFLPNELLVEIFGKVASQSIVDLCKVKLSCKEFLNAAENDHVYQRASMENFSLVPLPWFTEQKECWFLKRCRESGNLEIAYREGMVEYFSSGDVDRGLEKLKKAAMNGHDEGKYVYSMILMCSDKERKQGLELFLTLNASTCIRRCRKRVKYFVRSMWLNNIPMLNHHSFLCSSNTCQTSGKMMLNYNLNLSTKWWSSSDQDQWLRTISCHYCLADYELLLFSHIFQPHY